MFTIGNYLGSYTSPQIAQRPITPLLVNLRKSHMATSLCLSTGDKDEDLPKREGGTPLLHHACIPKRKGRVPNMVAAELEVLYFVKTQPKPTGH